MAELRQRATINAPVDTVYQVISDVEKYPQFLSDIKKVRRKEDLIEMTVQVGPFELVMVHRATFVPNESVTIRLVRGPFKKYDARWTLTAGEEGTDVRYDMVYELDLKIPGASGIVGAALDDNTRKTIAAFKKRVASLQKDDTSAR